MKIERIRRMNNIIQNEICRIFREEMGDPRINLVTITHVKMSKDLKYASVYCSTLKNDEKDEIMKALEGAKGFVQHKIADNLELRYTPHIRFILDESIEDAFKMMDLLHKIEENN